MFYAIKWSTSGDAAPLRAIKSPSFTFSSLSPSLSSPFPLPELECYTVYQPFSCNSLSPNSNTCLCGFAMFFPIIPSCKYTSVMLSPWGQVSHEAKILSSSLSSKICPRPWPRVFVLDMSLNFSFGPCEIVCNANIGNISEFVMVS